MGVTATFTVWVGVDADNVRKFEASVCEAFDAESLYDVTIPENSHLEFIRFYSGDYCKGAGVEVFAQSWNDEVAAFNAEVLSGKIAVLKAQLESSFSAKGISIPLSVFSATLVN